MAAHPHRQRTPLGDFLRENEREIFDAWKREMLALSRLPEISESALVDHLPNVLALISDIIDTAQACRGADVDLLAKQHALDRLGRGFDLDIVLMEYSLLRCAILEAWKAHVGSQIGIVDLEHLNAAFDESQRQAVVRFARAREKLLKGIDRVAEAALGSSELEVFLGDLIRAALDSMEAVNTVAILLREGDRLVTKAAAGLEGGTAPYSIGADEGFEGQIAARAEPMFLPHAAIHPLVTSKAIRDAGVRALYGVPLSRDGVVVGVAHIGSLTAHEFSEEDKLLFRSMASRATAVIAQATILENLRAAEAEAQRAVKARERVLAVVSHDLRNYLAPISMSATLMEQLCAAGRSDELGPRLDVLRRGVRGMKRLVDDLLDLASIEQGELTIHKEPVEIRSLLEEVARLHEPIAKEKGIGMRTDLDVEGVSVLADRERVLQALGNLLGNAIKFSRAGDEIVLRATADDENVIVSVRDTGPGIAPDVIESIFDPFVASRVKGARGAGLGLYIARGIVQRHGGRIWCESEVGRGSTFHFTLPRRA